MCKWVQPQMSNCLRTALNCFPGCLPSPQVQCIARRRPQCTATPRQQRWGRSRTTSRSQGQDQCLFSVFFSWLRCVDIPNAPKLRALYSQGTAYEIPLVGEIFFSFLILKCLNLQPSATEVRCHNRTHSSRIYTLLTVTSQCIYLSPLPSPPFNSTILSHNRGGMPALPGRFRGSTITRVTASARVTKHAAVIYWVHVGKWKATVSYTGDRTARKLHSSLVKGCPRRRRRRKKIEYSLSLCHFLSWEWNAECRDSFYSGTG